MKVVLKAILPEIPATACVCLCFRQIPKSASPPSPIGAYWSVLDTPRWWNVAKQFFAIATLLELQLESGRTHQIRAHMKHIGHPLFNDDRYGGDQILRGERSASYKAFIQNCFSLCPRQALHAKTLGFIHPVTKQQMDFNSEWPSDLMSVIEKWRAFIKGTTRDTFEI